MSTAFKLQPAANFTFNSHGFHVGKTPLIAGGASISLGKLEFPATALANRDWSATMKGERRRSSGRT